jgi:hypothetical protein
MSRSQSADVLSFDASCRPYTARRDSKSGVVSQHVPTPAHHISLGKVHHQLNPSNKTILIPDPLASQQQSHVAALRQCEAMASRPSSSSRWVHCSTQCKRHKGAANLQTPQVPFLTAECRTCDRSCDVQSSHISPCFAQPKGDAHRERGQTDAREGSLTLERQMRGNCANIESDLDIW